MPRIRSMMTAGVLFVAGLLLTGVACAGFLAPTASPRPTTISSPVIPLASETATPLYQQVKLESSPWNEKSAADAYQISAQTPVLVGSSDRRVKAFNSEMAAVVKKAVADFKGNVADLPPIPNSAPSTFDMRFNLLSAPGDILSLKFDIQTFYSGAAHPGQTSQTVNFDLARGQDIDLADLFVPDADFLTPISKYSVDQLDGRDIGFQGFELGATATLQNYRNWNITADGLMITFDEYQVAPYAAGPQTVVIPYKELAQIIEPDGPLAAYYHQ